MNYISTRGGMAPLPFSDILLEGLAPDGGLAVPEQLPQISAETLESWRGLPYADLAFEVLSRFATDIPAEDLRRLTRAAYTPQIFNSEDIVPLRPLNDGLSLLGLSEGPTLAFKDMAMQFLGQVFEYVPVSYTHLDVYKRQHQDGQYVFLSFSPIHLVCPRGITS